MVELFSPQLMKRSNMIRCYSCPIQELIMCDWVVWTPASSSFHPLARRRKQIRRSVSPFSQCGSYQRTPGEVTARAWSQRPRRAYWCNSHAFYPDRCVLSLQEEVTAHYSCENRGLFFTLVTAVPSCAWTENLQAVISWASGGSQLRSTSQTSKRWMYSFLCDGFVPVTVRPSEISAHIRKETQHKRTSLFTLHQSLCWTLRLPEQRCVMLSRL